MPRVASLLPQITEMICSLGMERHLVARSHACDFPRTVLSIPPVTEPKVALPGIGYGLGERARALLQEGLCPHRVDGYLLRDLRPEIIFTRFDLPEAGIDAAALHAAAGEWLGEGIRLVSMDTGSLAEVWQSLRLVAAELGAPEEGVRLTMQLQHRMAAILSQALDCTERPRVTALAGFEPLELVGGLVPELVEMAGGKWVPFVKRGRRTPLSLADVQASDPDLVVVVLPGMGRAQAREIVQSWANREQWTSLRAVQNEDIVVCDSSSLFTRVGPRAVELLEVLAEIVHPGEFQFGHRGTIWEPV